MFCVGMLVLGLSYDVVKGVHTTAEMRNVRGVQCEGMDGSSEILIPVPQFGKIIGMCVGWK